MPEIFVRPWTRMGRSSTFSTDPHRWEWSRQLLSLTTEEAHRNAQSITTTNLPNSYQILCAQKKTAECQVLPTGPEDRASPAPDTGLS